MFTKNKSDKIENHPVHVMKFIILQHIFKLVYVQIRTLKYG